MNKIYLDYAATSSTKPEVFEAMKPYFSQKFGNASSIHEFGRETKAAVEKSREIIAKYINCNPDEIIFTSGGTESDNLAIRGFVEAYRISHIAYHNKNRNNKRLAISHKPHLITSAFEHHAVLDTCKDLEERGLAEVSYIKPDKKGIISVKSVKKAIKPNTVLITIMYVNNEIGTIQPIQEIAKAISQYNESRIKNKVKKHNSLFTCPQCPEQSDGRRVIHNSQIFFHTDAVQAIEYQCCDVKKLGVDMLSLSAHKFGGPKGVGALFVRKGVKLHHQNIGGAQEWNLRAGTYNTSSIVGMGEAIRLLKNQKSKIKNQNLLKLRNHMIDRILKEVPNTRLNGDRVKRNPNNVNISFKYIEGEAILLNLDMAGIAASSGSACTSGSLDPSHVLLSIGLKHEDAHGSIRFTLGDSTTKDDIDYTIQVLKKTANKLRSVSPFGKEK